MASLLTLAPSSALDSVAVKGASVNIVSTAEELMRLIVLGAEARRVSGPSLPLTFVCVLSWYDGGRGISSFLPSYTSQSGDSRTESTDYALVYPCSGPGTDLSHCTMVFGLSGPIILLVHYMQC